MSKKHFIALADVMRECKPASANAELVGQWLATVARVADFCKSQNSNFKRDRWIAYINGECGPNGGKVK